MKETKCVMCGEREIFLTEEGNVIRFFIAPQTNEVLCSKCNDINNSIARGKNDLRVGREIIKKIK